MFAIVHAVAATLALAASPAFAQADDIAAFYAGRTITFVSGSSPGGSYDVGSRLIARHLGRHIPGKPNVIVQNMRARAAWRPPTTSIRSPPRTAA